VRVGKGIERRKTEEEHGTYGKKNGIYGKKNWNYGN
jgi:hypothetical protein